MKSQSDFVQPIWSRGYFELGYAEELGPYLKRI